MARDTTLYLRGLPELLVREAKATAARRWVTPTALVAEALQQLVGAPPAGSEQPEARETGGARRTDGTVGPREGGLPGTPASWGEAGAGAAGRSGATADLAESMRWFEANRERLVRRYRNRHVAIDGGRVFDHDRDSDALARRVSARLRSRPAFMPKVTAEGPVVAVPSPRRRSPAGWRVAVTVRGKPVSEADLAGKAQE